MNDEWKLELPEDLRGLPLVQEAKDFVSVVKQAVDFQRMLGNSIRVPSENASADEQAAFLEKVQKHGLIPKDKFQEAVRPTTPDAYAILQPPQDAQALGLTQTQVDVWKAEAHAMGLSPGQFDALAQSRIGAIRELVKARQDRFDAADAALRQDWGDSLEQRKAVALQAAQKFGGQAWVDALGETPDPAVLKALGEIGKQFAERGMGDLTPRPTFSETREEAATKLVEIQNNPNHPFNLGRQKAGKVAHEAALADVVRLRAISMGQKPTKDFMFDEVG